MSGDVVDAPVAEIPPLFAERPDLLDPVAPPSVRSAPRRRLPFAGSLAWPALLIVGVRIAMGVVIERAALGMYGFLDFPPSKVLRPENSAIAGGFIRWDAAIYLRIARNGYQPKVLDDPAFFPAYPYATRALHVVTRIGWDSSAVAVSWIALFFAAWGVMRFTRAVFPTAPGWRAACLLVFFPVSVFLLAGYAESLFVAFTAWSLVALAERRPWWAAVLGGLSAVARPEGILLIVAILTWVVMHELARPARDYRWLATRAAGVGGIAALPVAAYSLFVWRRYGSPFEWMKVNDLAWHRRWTWPLHPLFSSLRAILGHRLHGSTAANYVATYLVDDAAMIGAIVGLVALGVIIRRHRRDLLWVMPAASLPVLLVATNAPWGTDPQAWARIIMCVVPLYAVASRIRSETVWALLLAGSATLAAVFQIVFNTGFWLT